MSDLIRETDDHDVPPALPLRYLSAAATATTLIGLLGLLVLFGQDAFAQEEGNGFGDGARTFTNPFANVNPGAPPDAPPQGAEDEFDDEDMAQDAEAMNRQREQPRGGPSRSYPGGRSAGAGGGNGGLEKDVPEPQKSDKGVEVGGGPAGGVISHREVDALSVDPDTGFGSNEIVTDFNYPDADILDLAKTMGKLTGKNFIFDKDVKGRISIVSNSAITVGDAWRAFLTALDINNFTLIPSGKYIRIARQRDARDKQIRTYVGEKGSPDVDALITRVFSLKYIGAEEIARTFRSFMPANARIIPHEQTNTVIVTDTGSNIAKLAQMLEFLDVEGFDAGIEVIAVRYASAVELAKLIDTLLPGTGAAAGARPRRAGGAAGGGSFSPRRTKEGGVINTIIADERTNTLIVHANGKGADEVRDLVGKLDRKLPSSAGGGKIHVVYLQFADAEKIAQTLNNLSSAASRPSAGSARRSALGENPSAAALFEGTIKISADKATNSLVITASPADFATLQRVIARLDIPLDQVYVEAIIMEMSLGKDFSYSSNIALPGSKIAFMPNQDLVGFLANPLSSRGLVLPLAAGGETTIDINGQSRSVPNVAGLIRAIQTNSNANVLATPQILTLDNTEATFESAERIPQPTQTIAQSQTTTSVTREKVGLSIKIKPQINKVTAFVKLDIETKLEDFSGRELPSQVAQVALATSERVTKTSVVVADQDTVVLGGLVRDKRSDSVSKVPILGDIPLLGWLFRSKSSVMEKTNLLVFITPHIIRQYDKVRALLDKKLQERDEFIEGATGGSDPLREYRDDIIRKLPDMTEIMNQSQERSATINTGGNQ